MTKLLTLQTPAVRSAFSSLLSKIESATLKAICDEGVTVLRPFESGNVTVEFFDTPTSIGMEIKDRNGATVCLAKPYVQTSERSDWNPARWLCWKTMVDLSGQRWMNHGGPEYVVDDFGTLVPVEGGAAC